MRRTANTLAVAAVLLADPDGRHYGYDLRRRSGVRSGRLYPLLRRFEESGLVTGDWEREEISDGRRGYPLRRYYRLTADGRTQLAAFVEGAK